MLSSYLQCALFDYVNSRRKQIRLNNERSNSQSANDDGDDDKIIVSRPISLTRSTLDSASMIAVGTYSYAHW